MNSTASHSRTLNILLMLAAIIIIIGGLKLGADLIVQFLLAVFFAVILSPLVFYLARYVPLSVSVLLVITLVVISLFLLVNMIGSSAAEFSNELPRIESQLQQNYHQAIRWLASMGVSVDESWMSQNVDTNRIPKFITGILGQIGNVFSQGFIIVLMIIFMIFEASSYTNKLKLASDNATTAIVTSEKIVNSLRHYLSLKTVLSLMTGGIIGVACLLLDVQFALLWAVLAFLLNFIPNIGSILAAVPAILISFVDPNNSLLTTGLLAFSYLAANMIIGNVVEPKVLGKGMGLSTLVAFLSLVFWGWIFGMVGMFLSVPLTMVLKTLLEASPETRSFAVMLASEDSVKA